MQLNWRKGIKKINFKNLIENKKAKQVSALYGSMVFGILIGIGVSVVNTRLLGPQQYGDLKFLQNLYAKLHPRHVPGEVMRMQILD